jgi:hypothetical protein
MSTLPYTLCYTINVRVADGQMEDPPQWGFSQGYSFAYIKAAITKSLYEYGYAIARIRQELDSDVSIEVRTQELLDNIIRREKRLVDYPRIELVVFVRRLQ